MQSVKVGNVPVARLRFLVLLLPLHDGAVASDFRRHELFPCRLYLFVQLILHMQNLCRLDALGKQIPQNLVVHGNARRIGALLPIGKYKGIFRGHGRTGL